MAEVARIRKSSPGEYLARVAALANATLWRFHGHATG
jgi:hypothetical protein